MPNTFSMAPRYVREFAARTAFASPRRDVFDGLASKVDRLFRQPPPVDRGCRAARRRPRCRAARPRRRCAPAAGRIARGWWSPPRPTCASSSTATTTGCGRGSSASTRGRSTRRSTTPTIASRTSRSCATCSPACAPVLTDDAVVVLVIGDVETRPRPADPGWRRPRRAGLGAGRRARGLPARRASRSTTWPRSAR